MSTNDDFSDRKRTMLGRAVVPPPKPPVDLDVKGPGTLKQDRPGWLDEDEEDAGNKTAALDLSQLQFVAGQLGQKPLTLEEDDDPGEKTVAGMPLFDESSMSQAPPARGATLEQVQAPLVSDGPARGAAEALGAAAGGKAAARVVETEAKTQAHVSPFAEQTGEEKTQAQLSPFAEPPMSLRKPPAAADIETEAKTTMSDSPLMAKPASKAQAFRKGSGDDEKTRVGAAPSEDRTQMARPLADIPQSESTMLFDASALLAARSEGPVGVVTIVAGPDNGKEFFLRSESTVVGRGLDCDLVLNDPSVSRRHFRIDRREEHYHVVDLGSGNGTKVDGARMNDKRLGDGMKIVVGTTTLQFGFVGSELRAPVDEQLVVKKAGWGLRFLFIALFLGLVGAGTFYAGEKLGWWRVVTPQVATEDLTKAEGPKPWEPIVDAVREQISKRALAEAKVSLTEAQAAGASADLVKTLSGRIATAEKHRALVAEQRKAIEGKRFSEAMRALKTVPTTSPYYTEADILIDDARGKLVDSLKDEADQLATKEQFEEAKAKLQLVLKELPEDAEAKTRIAEIDEEAAELAAAKAKPPIAAVPVAIAPAPPVGEPGAEAPPVAPTGPTGEAMPPAAPTGATGVDVAMAPIAPTGATGATGPEVAVAPSGPTGDPGPGAAAVPATGAEVPAVAPPTGALAPAEAPSVAPVPRPTAPTAPAAPEFERANFRQGYKLYGQRAFSGAAEFFDEIAADDKYRKADRKRGTAMAAAVRRFGEIYGRAETAVRTRSGEAVSLLDEARKLDTQVNGTFQGDIRRSLAEVYASKASAAFQSGSVTEAVQLARKAKSFNPGDSSAQFILDRVEGKIDALLAEGRGGKGKKAENALKNVIALLGADDPRYQEAKKLLNDLLAATAAQDDD